MNQDQFKSFKKFKPLFVSLISVLLLTLLVLGIKSLGYHLIYSTTPSVPQGLYLVVPAKHLQVNDMVEFVPPLPILSLMQTRHWLPKNHTMLKQVAALAGDHVCIKDNWLLINGKQAVEIGEATPLPKLTFCDRIAPGRLLLLGTGSSRSFDSRYFGPIPVERIIGKAIAIYLNHARPQ